MSMLPIDEKDYSDGLTKQAFKDSCDINKILKKAQTGLGLSHLFKHPAPEYGVFENYDLLEAHERVEKARSIFADLPSEVRREFNQDPFAFAKFASDPENNGRLAEILPELAAPGRQMPNPVKRGGVGAGEATSRDDGKEESKGEAKAAPAAPEAASEDE